MELKDFVAKTIAEIVQGVREAQQTVGPLGAVVNPRLLHGVESQSIDFDVQVSTSEGGKMKGGLGVFVGGFGAGAQSQSDSKEASAGRIRFTVKVQLPAHPEQKK
jgi:hypothetical protein